MQYMMREHIPTHVHANAHRHTRDRIHTHIQFKMLVIPLIVFSQVILERPGILEGMTWLLEAQNFASSQNHVDLLLAMGEMQVYCRYVPQLCSFASPSRQDLAVIRGSTADQRYVKGGVLNMKCKPLAVDAAFLHSEKPPTEACMVPAG